MWQDQSHSFDAAGRAWPRADLRAGDEDRRQVVAELQRHYVDGRLTADELGERVSRATAARTFGELAATLSDLPPARQPVARQGGGWSRGVFGFGLPLEAAIAGLAVLALVAMLVLPMLHLHLGVFPMWPLFIWGFFFFGRPGRGRRYH